MLDRLLGVDRTGFLVAPLVAVLALGCAGGRVIPVDGGRGGSGGTGGGGGVGGNGGNGGGGGGSGSGGQSGSGGLDAGDAPVDRSMDRRDSGPEASGGSGGGGAGGSIDPPRDAPVDSPVDAPVVEVPTGGCGPGGSACSPSGASCVQEACNPATGKETRCMCSGVWGCLSSNCIDAGPDSTGEVGTCKVISCGPTGTPCSGGSSCTSGTSRCTCSGGLWSCNC